MTLSTELKENVIRSEIEKTWREYYPRHLCCYANVAEQYMQQKAEALGEAFNPKIAAIIAGEIAWWVRDTCRKYPNIHKSNLYA